MPDIFATLRARIDDAARPLVPAPIPGVVLAGALVVVLGLAPGLVWALAGPG
jgi:hypothetical protein